MGRKTIAKFAQDAPLVTSEEWEKQFFEKFEKDYKAKSSRLLERERRIQEEISNQTGMSDLFFGMLLFYQALSPVNQMKVINLVDELRREEILIRQGKERLRA